MPKKHAPTFAKPQGSVHPSLESRSTAANPSGPKTVNERINQLRREQAPKATAERRNEIIDVVTRRTVPPALRHILNIPEIDPPKPKPGRTRPQGQVRTRRPPPGPAPPASWLNDSQHAPPDLRSTPKQSRQRMSKFGSLARLKDGERKLPLPKSLVDQTLKILASNWHWLAEFEQHYLAALPAHLKENILSYLSLYGEDGSPDLKTLKLLFMDELEVVGGTGSSEVRQLDFTGLLSEALSLSDINKYMSRPRSVADPSRKSELPPPPSKKQEDNIAESWEDEIDAPPSLHSLRFPNLTRLSLAHPGNQASWSGLLAACSNLNNLTHLSLAYWSTPSTTPNAATTSMVSKHAKPVALGGSHYYSQLDDDWHEAANILRRLSLMTYRLQWLDLEGCEWYKALTWDSSQASTRDQDTFRRDEFHLMRAENANSSRFVEEEEEEEENWTVQSAKPGPNWNGAWERIETLVLSQGWVPNNINAIQVMPAGALSVELLNYLRAKEDRRRKKAGIARGLKGALGRMSLGAPTPGGIACGHWVEKEKASRDIEIQLRLIRKQGNGSRVKVLYGWGKDEEDSDDEDDDVVIE